MFAFALGVLLDELVNFMDVDAGSVDVFYVKGKGMIAAVILKDGGGCLLVLLLFDLIGKSGVADVIVVVLFELEMRASFLHQP